MAGGVASGRGAPGSAPFDATRMSPGRRPRASTMFSHAAMMKWTCVEEERAFGDRQGGAGGWLHHQRLPPPLHAHACLRLPPPTLPAATPTCTPSGLISDSALAAPSVAPDPPMSNCGVGGRVGGGYRGWAARRARHGLHGMGCTRGPPVDETQADATSSQPRPSLPPCPLHSPAMAATHLHQLDHGASARLDVVAAAVKGQPLAHDRHLAPHLACHDGCRVGGGVGVGGCGSGVGAAPLRCSASSQLARCNSLPACLRSCPPAATLHYTCARPHAPLGV